MLGAILTQTTIHEPQEEVIGYHWVLGTLNEEEKKIYSVWYEMVILIDQRDKELNELKEEGISDAEEEIYEKKTDRIEDMAKCVYAFLFASIKYRFPDFTDDIRITKGFKIIRMFDGIVSQN